MTTGTFPASPVNGQTAEAGGRYYTYNSTIGAWENTGAAPTAGTLGNLTLTGNLQLSSTSQFQGDFSNATISSRSNFITTATNATTGIYALPNGSATAASWQATNASDPTNASKVLIATNGSTDVQLVSGRNGTGTYLPLSFYTNNVNVMTLTTSGNLTLNTLNANITAGQFISNIATGSAPFIISSTTKVTGLNVEQVDGYDASISSAANTIVVRDANSNITTAGQYVSTLAAGTAPFVVTSTTQVANLNVATAGTAGTVTTAAQPNITSTGTLTSLAVTQAAITAAAPVTNINTTWNNASVSFTGFTMNVTDTASAAASNIFELKVGGVSEFTVNKSGNTSIAGTISGTQLISNIATGTAPLVVTSTTQVANLNVAAAGTATTAGTVTTAAQPNITSTGTLTSLGVSGAVTASTLVSNVATGTAPLTVTSTTQVANLNVATAGTAGTVTTAAQPNITSTGTLTSLGVSGAVTASTLVSNVATGTAPFTVTSTTQVANLNVAVAGTVSAAAQGNITSLGSLTGLTVLGAASANALTATGAVTGNSNVTTVTGALGIRSIASTYTDNVALASATIANAAIHALGIPTLAASNLTVTFSNAASFYISGAPAAGTNATITNAYALLVGAGNVSLAGTGASTTTTTGVLRLGGGLGLAGNIFAGGTLNGTQLVSNIATGTAPLVVTSTTQVANLSVATAGTAGTVTTAAQPNITSTGTLTSLGVSGAVTASTLVSNVATGTAPLTVTSTTQVANLNVAVAGTVSAASQPNITSHGTLVSLTIAAGNATVAPITLTSSAGTVLTAATAGTIEYDGTTVFATPSTNYGRASLAATVYTSGTGTSLTPTATGETTAQALFPAAGDTITLPIGTYHIVLQALITRGATSTTSATARINLGGGGTAVGTFNGSAVSSIAAGGATNQFMFSGVALTVDNVVSAANTTASGVYNVYLSGILRITTAGTFIPKYSLSAALTGATTATAPSALDYLMIQQITTSGSAAATGGWA